MKSGGPTYPQIGLCFKTGTMEILIYTVASEGKPFTAPLLRDNVTRRVGVGLDEYGSGFAI